MEVKKELNSTPLPQRNNQNAANGTATTIPVAKPVAPAANATDDKNAEKKPNFNNNKNNNVGGNNNKGNNQRNMNNNNNPRFNRNNNNNNNIRGGRGRNDNVSFMLSPY